MAVAAVGGDGQMTWRLYLLLGSLALDTSAFWHCICILSDSFGGRMGQDVYENEYIK